MGFMKRRSGGGDRDYHDDGEISGSVERLFEHADDKPDDARAQAKLLEVYLDLSLILTVLDLGLIWTGLRLI